MIWFTNKRISERAFVCVQVCVYARKSDFFFHMTIQKYSLAPGRRQRHTLKHTHTQTHDKSMLL